MINRCFDRLDAPQRQAIECAFYDGLSHSEISTKLSRPLGTIKTQIRTGLLRLRECLGRFFESTDVGACDPRRRREDMTCTERRDSILLHVRKRERRRRCAAAERESIRSHLASGCPTCSAALAEAEATLAQIPLSLPLQSPSPSCAIA